jgi:hypothetical protein
LDMNEWPQARTDQNVSGLHDAAVTPCFDLGRDTKNIVLYESPRKHSFTGLTDLTFIYTPFPVAQGSFCNYLPFFGLRKVHYQPEIYLYPLFGYVGSMWVRTHFWGLCEIHVRLHLFFRLCEMVKDDAGRKPQKHQFAQIKSLDNAEFVFICIQDSMLCYLSRLQRLCTFSVS